MPPLQALQIANITTFDDDTIAAITVMMKQQHARLAQLDRLTSERATTARNYDSTIKALGSYLTRVNAALPTRSVLAQWRDDMLTGRADPAATIYSVGTVNARLSAARKLLRAIAEDYGEAGLERLCEG